jgi:hypothetical protein
MEASPLTQQTRPETFTPKIVQLYENLFKVCPSNPILPAPTHSDIQLQTPDDVYVEPSEGFWREFFLLPPDRGRLHSLLDGLSPDETLSLQVRVNCGDDLSTTAEIDHMIQTQTKHLFTRAISEASSGVAPVDSYALEVSIYVRSRIKPSH